MIIIVLLIKFIKRYGFDGSNSEVLEAVKRIDSQLLDYGTYVIDS